MGYSSWSDAAYRSVSGARAGAKSAEIFRGARSVDPLMDPKGLTFREARDSEHHPHSVPIIVAFDVTASMGDIPTMFAQELLGTLMTRLVEEGWITDPQLLFAAVGDAVSDSAPFQVGQFESGLEMDMWLTRMWLESRGGDVEESYLLPHWFAAHHTSTDAWEKREKKGYLITIGDAPNKPLSPSQIQRVFGGDAPTAPTDDQAVVAAAQERWEVFHVLVSRRGPANANTLKGWQQLLGDRVVVLTQVRAICDLIGVLIGRCEGTVTDDRAQEILAAAGAADVALPARG